MRKRWLRMYVENEIGVLARVSGLIASKSCNISSLTLGPAKDETVSVMTINLTCNDQTFEHMKKQLDRCIEVIQVIDETENISSRQE